MCDDPCFTSRHCRQSDISRRYVFGYASIDVSCLGHHETLHYGKPAEMDIGVSHDASIMRRPPHTICRRGHNFSNMTVAEICSVRAAARPQPTATAIGISRRARHHACCGRASQQRDTPPAMWRMIQATGQVCICPVADTGASIVTVSRVAVPQPPAHTRKPRPCERGVWRHQT